MENLFTFNSAQLRTNDSHPEDRRVQKVYRKRILSAKLPKKDASIEHDEKPREIESTPRRKKNKKVTFDVGEDLPEKRICFDGLRRQRILQSVIITRKCDNESLEPR
jgi:hypothetical protein